MLILLSEAMVVVQASQTPSGLFLLQALTTWVPAFVTLLGVGFGFYWQQRLADRERILTTKRDLYLHLSVAAVSAIQLLPSLASFDEPPSAKQMEVLSKASARAQTLADPGLVGALSAFTRVLSRTYFELMRIRMPGEFLRHDNAEAVRKLAEARQKLATVIEERRLHVLGKAARELAGDLRNASLDQEIADLLSSAAAFANESAEASTKLLELTGKVLDWWSACAPELMGKKVDLLGKVRAELGLPFDRETHFQIQNAALEESLSMLGIFRSGVASDLAAATAEPKPV